MHSVAQRPQHQGKNTMPHHQSSSPWGGVKPSAPASGTKRSGGLLDIMSEQLAANLDAAYNASPPAFEVVDVVAEPPSPSSFSLSQTTTATTAEDLDYALAMQLQEEEDAQRWREERHGPKGLVTVRSYPATPQSAQRLAELNEQLQSDDEDEDADGQKKKKKKSPPWKVRDKSLKGQGGDQPIVTKHDLEINGHKNARRLERTVPNCGDLGDTLVPNRIYNSFQHRMKKLAHAEKGVVGRTVEADTTRSKTLDAKTRLTLHRLLDAGVLDAVNYVVRTGKEGVVFHAVGPLECSREMPGRAPFPSNNGSRSKDTGKLDDQEELVDDLDNDEDDYDDNGGEDAEFDDSEFIREGFENATAEFAVKVYKTNLSEFTNRHEYIEGDHRFASLGQLSRQNKQKIVRVWAEKELKNMTRMHRAGIPCPEPIRLIKNVLIMEFIGKDGWGAPQLGEIDLGSSSSRASKCFVQVLLITRAMWDRCKLVHADLSEFNVLFQDGKCYVVDVGQAVERLHPNAQQFLRRDIFNVLTFFFNKCKRTGCGGADEYVDTVMDWIMNGPPNVDENVDDNPWCVYAKEELGSWADYRLACKFGELLVV